MREACLYNNRSIVPIFLKIYRALMRWTLWSFLGEVAVTSPHDGGTHLEWGSGDEGSLLNSFGWEFILFIKTHFYGGALTSHFMEEHSSPTLFSWWRHQMETCSASLDFVRGIHRSPTNSPHTDQWRGALMFSWICAWTNGWVNNQDAGDLRRHRAHNDVTVAWCRILIQLWDLSAFNASLLSNFELVKRVKLEGSVYYGRNGLKFGTLLYPVYHSLKLSIFCTRRQFKFVVSDHS